MMTRRGPMVLEFNTRFGDPETQAILMRLDTDIVDLFEAAINGTANHLAIKMKPGASVCVIAASEGYPGKYPSGRPITGLDLAVESEDVFIFHSGTAVRDEVLVTAGGRVLGITAVSEAGLEDALNKAYETIKSINFEGIQFRRDIGWRALEKENI
jgi:phosphoribosylamine--glycine ligase